MHHGYTPLFIAARTGQLELLRGLLEANAEKDKASHSATPLFIIPRSGQSEVARRLLEANADKDKAMHDGSTPLFMALRTGSRRLHVCCWRPIRTRTGPCMMARCSLRLRAHGWRLHAVCWILNADKDQAM
ncbi:ASB2 [Symbiodinium sp. KB8]|nr:ASB2 [Symbiodinium sp. KB8]